MLTRRTFLMTVAAVALGAMLPAHGKKPNASEPLLLCPRTDHSDPSQAIPHDQWILWGPPSAAVILMEAPQCDREDARILADSNIRLLSRSGWA
jgi:hypothetical protein